MIFASFFIEKKIQSPALTLPRLSHATSCTPTKSNLYRANSLATVVSDPDLHRLLTFHVPNLMCLFHCLGCTKGLAQARSTRIRFVTRTVFMVRSCYHLAHPPTPTLEGHPLSAVRYCLFNIFASTLYTGGLSSIRNLRTRHAVVTGTHLSWHYEHKNGKFIFNL
jgi:hypothetical protein